MLCYVVVVLLGFIVVDVWLDVYFVDLGGDLFLVLLLVNLLYEIFGVDVLVGVIVSLVSDLWVLVDYIEVVCIGVR